MTRKLARGIATVVIATLITACGGGGGGGGSSSDSLAGNGPATTAPMITTQPSNVTVTVGSTATFTVAASGTAPLTYQWQKDGTAIMGATAASYTTPTVTITDDGAMFAVAV